MICTGGKTSRDTMVDVRLTQALNHSEVTLNDTRSFSPLSSGSEHACILRPGGPLA